MQGSKLILLIFAFIIVNIQSELISQTDGAPKKPAQSASENDHELTYEVIQNKDKSYGYKIFRDGKAMILQESMPALPGNNGFPRKIDAERMANLVIQKIKQGIMPPTVSVAEVDSIRALKK